MMKNIKDFDLKKKNKVTNQDNDIQELKFYFINFV